MDAERFERIKQMLATLDAMPVPDRAAYLAFLDSELGSGLGHHPNIADLTMRDYAVDDVPTEVTHGRPVAVG